MNLLLCIFRTIFIIGNLFLLTNSNGFAQYENIWAFGVLAGIDFNTTPPTPIRTGINTTEGSASICDANGKLLFYTDGHAAWDRNHTLMPNGYNLPGVVTNITASTTQGALIIPHPGNADKYYIFSLGNLWGTVQSSPYVGKLYYSEIDMTRNNGLGDVSPGIKGIPLDSMLTEHMTAVSGNNCNIWLLALSRSDTTFKAYNINFNGIDPRPVLSPRIAGGGQYNGILGSIDVAPSRNKLAIAQGNLVLYDFDVRSGRITRPLILDTRFDPYYYSVCFSPDNTKLYAGTGADLQQFDLISPDDTAAVLTSKILIGAGLGYSSIKRAPDGKIYCANHNSGTLHVIHQPTFAGTTCQFEARGFTLFYGTRSQIGLPNLATIVVPRKFHYSRTDTIHCVDRFLLEPRDTVGINYIWDNGTTAISRTIDSSGTYWVSYQMVTSQCDEYVDSFTITIYRNQRFFTATTEQGMCKEDTVFIQATNLGGVNYTWEDGSTGMGREISRPGAYSVSYEVDSLCHYYIDSFMITYPENDYKVSFSIDTLVCQDELIKIRNTSDGHYDNFTWSFGDHVFSVLQNPEHAYPYAGSYTVQLIGKLNDYCSDTAWQMTMVDSIVLPKFFTDRDSICTGEGITFIPFADNNATTHLHWQFGDGLESTSNEKDKMYHAYDTSGSLQVILTAQYRACPEQEVSGKLYVHGLPNVSLSEDTFLCLEGLPVILKNLKSPPTVLHHNLWNTGDTNVSIRVVHPGTYSLTVSTEPLGCSATESVTIHKDCYTDIPNAFTPNGDGVNDYFFPKQLLSRNVISFRMQIFNRWGGRVFETTESLGRGWDGRFNNSEQPADVYIYLVETGFVNGRQEKYEGNVTLIR